MHETFPALPQGRNQQVVISFVQRLVQASLFQRYLGELQGLTLFEIRSQKKAIDIPDHSLEKQIEFLKAQKAKGRPPLASHKESIIRSFVY